MFVVDDWGDRDSKVGDACHYVDRDDEIGARDYNRGWGVRVADEGGGWRQGMQAHQVDWWEGTAFKRLVDVGVIYMR